jgi:hypothetical protein
VWIFRLGLPIVSTNPESRAVKERSAGPGWIAMKASTVRADRLCDAEGRARGFRLTLGDETITLDPGKPWVKADSYKWVTRGLIEPPQSYHVLPDGTVEVNGEKITPEEPKAVERLEHEFNKRHAPGVEIGGFPAVKPSAPSPTASAPPSDHVQFTVRLDHLGHLVVGCATRTERLESGLRGLAALIQNGLMLRPESWHVDAMQRSVEIDGQRFECTEAGARSLQELLNTRYAPTLKNAGGRQVEITANPASATGFDIQFAMLQAGGRVAVKGHLAQDKLDILQDSAHCDLLKHGTLLKLSPPNLLIRRRRPDGGEEPIPGLPDLAYRRATAAELQQLLNHPLIRRDGGEGLESASLPAPSPLAGAAPPVGERASPPAPPVKPPRAESGPPPPKLPSTGALAPVQAPIPGPKEAPAAALFTEAEAAWVNTEVFWSLVAPLDLPVQEVWLTLPHVFENRRFEVLNFARTPVEALTDLRSESFYGFYLSHVDERNVILVYACRGRHLEWGTHKCVLQSSLAAEAEEFPESALRGLAQDPDGNFVFLVSPGYLTWLGNRAREYLAVCARFLTLEELLKNPGGCSFVWPRHRGEGAPG